MLAIEASAGQAIGSLISAGIFPIHASAAFTGPGLVSTNIASYTPSSAC